MDIDKTRNLGNDVKIVRTCVGMDCGGRCPLKVYVKDGVAIHVEGDDVEEPEQLRTCFRCRAFRQLVYHPDRLKYPMKRIGAKGEGKFERISWDEALDTIASNLKRVKENYGNSSIFLYGGYGFLGCLHAAYIAISRLLSMYGGFVTSYGNVSSEGCVFAVRAQYGDVMVGNSREELLNSRLIILWGWDPAKMIFGTNTLFYLARAKEAGARIISVDPVFNDTAATVADQWIPIRPGTDAAMLCAMAYFMVKNNLHNQKFLDTYAVGFDQYKQYIMGEEDGIAKTPAWAEGITGVPSEVIENLAREFATIKPAALMDGMGPARNAMGEQTIRCTMTLIAMTGNIGIKGGHAGGGLHGIPVGHIFRMPHIPVPKNPAEKGPTVRGSFDPSLRLIARIYEAKIWDAILEGKAGGFPSDIKAAWFCGRNPVNQLTNSNKAAEAMKKLEFTIVSEVFMCATARYADILLPISSHWERNDLARPFPSGPYYFYANKVIEPMYESKSDWEIACELAPRMGITDYNDKTEDQWLRHFVETAPDLSKEITDYDKFKNDGIHRVKMEPYIAFKEQIEDLAAHPFPTPSGKIEIYSQLLADINNPKIPPIPKYIESWEGLNDPLAKKYPLQLITPHPKRRAHSVLDNVPWLRELEQQSVFINPVDAKIRGFVDDDEVIVFNDRGTVIIPARITSRIMPGVVCIYEGAWYTPDEKGRDRGGCANVLTKDSYSPGLAFCANTALVQIKKFREDMS
ncbi:molybdopterin-dependent oxidoreductase [Thermodesulfobacteriota bacterium]